MAEKLHKLELINGVEGDSVYLNDFRIAGPKPWGGGTTLKSWKVSTKDLETALGRSANPQTPN